MKTPVTVMRVCALTAWALLSHAEDAPRRGGLVLQFDDGWTSWRTEVAPLLARAGGRATVFVNNQYIQNGRITLADLRALQDEFSWEIGSHGFAHVNAVRSVQQRGLEAWVSEQLQPSLAELRAAGLRVDQFVFPFNAFTPELGRAVLDNGLRSYRRADALALADGPRADGSVPGTSIDLTRFIPLAALKQWVDMAAARGQLLFLYGHRVVADEAFVTGRVVEVSSNELLADVDVALPQDEDVVLVPDVARRGASSLGGLSVAGGRRIRLSAGGPDLRRLTSPGATFLIGPSYGTRRSDFAGLVEYASRRLTFYTVSEVVSGKHRRAGQPAADGPERGLP